MANMVNYNYYISIGRTLIYPERYKEWENCVKDFAKHKMGKYELSAAISIMKALKNGVDVEVLAKQLNRNRGYTSNHIIKMLVFNFSPRGPEFWEAATKIIVRSTDKDVVKAKKEENRRLDAIARARKINRSR